MRDYGSPLAALIATVIVSGCGTSYDRDDWLIVSSEDTGIERVAAGTGSLKECTFLLGQFQWSGYVSNECATGCVVVSDEDVDCETVASRTDYLTRPPVSDPEN